MDYIDIIKKIRKEKGLTQRDMASILNLAQSTYNDIEHRKIKLSTEDFIKICKYFGISPNIITNDENTISIALTKQEVEELKRIKQIINKIDDQINFSSINNQNITIGNNNSNINFGIINKEKE